MATQVLLPGEVRIAAGAEPNPHIEGSAPQWADDSDATYATMEAGGAFVPQTAGDLDLLLPIPPLVSLIEWSVRASGTGTDPALAFDLFGLDGGGELIRLYGNDGLLLPPGGGAVTYTGTVAPTGPDVGDTWAWGAVGPTFRQVAEFLATGCYLNASSVSGVVTVYECSLTVTYALVGPPCQVYPVDYGAQVYPPTKARQRSNRVAGGYW